MEVACLPDLPGRGVPALIAGRCRGRGEAGFQTPSFQFPAGLHLLECQHRLSYLPPQSVGTCFLDNLHGAQYIPSIITNRLPLRTNTCGIDAGSSTPFPSTRYDRYTTINAAFG